MKNFRQFLTEAFKPLDTKIDTLQVSLEMKENNIVVLSLTRLQDNIRWKHWTGDILGKVGTTVKKHLSQNRPPEGWKLVFRTAKDGDKVKLKEFDWMAKFLAQQLIMKLEKSDAGDHVAYVLHDDEAHYRLGAMVSIMKATGWL